MENISGKIILTGNGLVVYDCENNDFRTYLSEYYSIRSACFNETYDIIYFAKEDGIFAFSINENTITCIHDQTRVSQLKMRPNHNEISFLVDMHYSTNETIFTWDIVEKKETKLTNTKYEITNYCWNENGESLTYNTTSHAGEILYLSYKLEINEGGENEIHEIGNLFFNNQLESSNGKLKTNVILEQFFGRTYEFEIINISNNKKYKIKRKKDKNGDVIFSPENFNFSPNSDMLIFSEFSPKDKMYKVYIWDWKARKYAILTESSTAVDFNWC